MVILSVVIIIEYHHVFLIEYDIAVRRDLTQFF